MAFPILTGQRAARRFPGSPENLRINSGLYEVGIDWINSLEDCDQRVAAVERVAAFAWAFHPGRFADGALENHLLRLGADSIKLPGSWRPPAGCGRSKSLQVATELYPTGGHTRMIAKWLFRDDASDHLLVLTSQKGRMPEFVVEAAKSRAAQIISLDARASARQRAGQLRTVARDFDRVILHAHPNDAVPVLAFALPDGPPVAMYNHAQFSFSLGSTVSDIVTNGLSYHRTISENYRFARRTALLTSTPQIDRLPSDQIEKNLAKMALQIRPDVPMILTIGYEQYFRPSCDRDFFSTLSKILGSTPEVEFVAVGISPQSSLIPSNLRSDPRCHFVGPVLDPVPYFRAADICLESFPITSPGALVESVARGEAFPIPAYGEDDDILHFDQYPILKYPFRPRDESQYIRCVQNLLGDLGDTRQQAHSLRAGIIDFDRTWQPQVLAIYDQLASLKHAPTEIPVSEMIDSEDCHLLANLQAESAAVKINALLPLIPAIQLQFLAVRGGVVPLSEALMRLLKRILKGLIKPAATAWSLIRNRSSRQNRSSL